MAQETGRPRRRKRNKPKKRPARKRKTSVSDIPDDLLELILLRLASPFLVRAAAACRRWRYVVADAGFLARFHSLHPPLVGVYHASNGRHGFDHGNAPASRGVDSRRFSLDFLPNKNSWKIVGSRGSLLLLVKRREYVRTHLHRISKDIIVCEPLTRRYQRIPFSLDSTCLGVFLLLGAGGGITFSNFRLLCARHEPVCAAVFFPGIDGGWRRVRSHLDCPETERPFDDHYLGRANGSIYWYWAQENPGATTVFALDEVTARFSLVRIPDGIWGLYDKRTARVIGGEDGALRLVRLTSGTDLSVFVRRSDEEWVLEKLVRMPEATAGLRGRHESFFQETGKIVAADDRCIVVTPKHNTWLVTVELDTMQVHQRNKYDGPVYPYELPWPPIL